MALTAKPLEVFRRNEQSFDKPPIKLTYVRYMIDFKGRRFLSTFLTPSEAVFTRTPDHY